MYARKDIKNYKRRESEGTRRKAKRKSTPHDLAILCKRWGLGTGYDIL